MDPNENATEQRQAANDAVELLAERLGPDLPRLIDLIDRASFRFRPALASFKSADQPIAFTARSNSARGAA